MTDGRGSQLFVRAFDEPTPDANISQLFTRTVFNYPSEAGRISQVFVRTFDEPTPSLRASQLFVRVLIKGRIDDPRVRAWPFTLDMHDNYVLRLGNTETLVYDNLSDQWYIWGSDTTVLWKAYTGANWLGGNKFAVGYGSNVVVGDDGNGSLYFLNPDGETDDATVEGVDATAFERVAQGEIMTKGYSSIPCYGINLEGSIGSLETTSPDVTLSFSDDRGNTYYDAGDVEVLAGEYDTRIRWLSLGAFTTPGRLFKFVDYGALKRIDSIEMDDGQE